MAFREIDPRRHKFWLWRCTCLKNLVATILFVNFPKAFDSIHREKVEQILLVYGLTKETIAAIMMLYRNIKVKVCSPVGVTDYFDIVAGVLQGDTLTPYLFIICLDNVLRTSIDKTKDPFQANKKMKQKMLRTISNADYADEIALLTNTPDKPKPCYIVWNEQLQAYVSMSTYTRQNTYALIKQVTSHETIVLWN